MRKSSAALLTASLAAAGTVAAAAFPAGATWAAPAAGIGRTGITATQRQPARLSLPRATGRTRSVPSSCTWSTAAAPTPGLHPRPTAS